MKYLSTPELATVGNAGAVANPAGSAASWSAILAGSCVAVGASLALMVLGAGLGFASLTVGGDPGVAATGLGVKAVIWLIVTQWLAAALGGYIAGRLRRRWPGTHTHEVFFRDTAHGLVTWALATIVVVALVGGSVRTLLTSEVRIAPGAAASLVNTEGASVSAYGVDALLRPAESLALTASATGDREARLEVQHIMINALAADRMSAADDDYLQRLVVQRAGVAPAEAKKRVATWVANTQAEAARSKGAIEVARRAVARTAIYTALALLIGAFIACVAAALGGQLRDLHP